MLNSMSKDKNVGWHYLRNGLFKYIMKMPDEGMPYYTIVNEIMFPKWLRKINAFMKIKRELVLNM